MKSIALRIIGITLIFFSCSEISDKPVFVKLSTDELSDAIKSDTSFISFYEIIRKYVDDMSDIKKAKFNEVTYRRLFDYSNFMQDTIFWKPLTEEWEKEWKVKFGSDTAKADSLINYWKKYLEENSLDKYVKIELYTIRKEYYEYVGDIKEVYLGFRMTPLQGTIQQIRFEYGYKAKILDDNKYYEKHSCIDTDPIYSPRVAYWEVDYSDVEIFDGKNVETFLRDYNMYIEITQIRKEGINISIDDFIVPDEVSRYLEFERNYPTLREIYREDVIKNLIRKDYMEKWEYTEKKSDEIREKEDKLCFDFLKQFDI